MRTVSCMPEKPARPAFRAWRAMLPLMSLALAGVPLMAQSESGEANLHLPDLDSATFLGGIGGRSLLMFGLIFCVLGMIFGLIIYNRLKNMAVHKSMLEVSELIYETCKTYLSTQGKFLILLECFIGVIIVFYFGFLQGLPLYKVGVILLFSVIGISGSYSVAAFGMRVNTFANSRAAFASLRGKAFPCYDIPLQAGMSIGMLLISVELIMMLIILLFIPGDLAGPCFIGFAIGESLGGGLARGGRHLHQDRGYRRGPHEDCLQDQGRRRAQPRRDRGLHGRQRGRFGGSLGGRL